jgi:hypothetical protein
MGVPSWQAERMIGRQTACWLLALDDSVPPASMAVALATAKAPGRSRRALRSRMAASPLTDAPRFVGDLEAAHRALWVRAADAGA